MLEWVSVFGSKQLIRLQCLSLFSSCKPIYGGVYTQKCINLGAVFQILKLVTKKFTGDIMHPQPTANHASEPDYV